MFVFGTSNILTKISVGECDIVPDTLTTCLINKMWFSQPYFTPDTRIGSLSLD